MQIKQIHKFSIAGMTIELKDDGGIVLDINPNGYDGYDHPQISLDLVQTDIFFDLVREASKERKIFPVLSKVDEYLKSKGEKI